MKTRFVMVLPLAASLMVPAMAQQSSTDQSQSQPAATQTQQSGDQNQAQNQNQATAGATGRQPLQYERHEGFWGKINPFARKKYVQRQLEPIRGRVNELDELTAQNAKNIKDVDSRAQEGIRVSMAKATEADQHALDAGNRAQMAHQTATQANTRLQAVEQVVGNIDQYQAATQAEIRFRPGQATLSKKAKDALDEIAEGVKGKNGYIIEVQGFAPGRGQAAIESSQRMAQSVVRYFVLNHEIPVYRIHLLGMGSARPASAEGERPRRTTAGRVDVTVLRNGVDQLAANTGSATMNAAPGTQGGMTGATGTSNQQQNQATPSSNNSNAQQPASNTSSEQGQSQQQDVPKR